MTSTAAAVAFYVYGVVPAGHRLPSLERLGLDASFAPELIESGPLAAVASRIRVDEPQQNGEHDEEQDAERALGRVLAHGALLERLVEAGVPVVPFRFGAAYAEREDVGALLRGREDALTEALSRVDGRIELGVKAYVDRERLAAIVREGDEQLRRLEAELEKATPGAAHLRRKQLERVAAEASARERAERAARLHERLAAGAAAARVNPLPEAREELEPILNGAYLVARERGDELRAAAAEAAAAQREVGMRIDVSGPWPAYNFVESER